MEYVILMAFLTQICAALSRRRRNKFRHSKKSRSQRKKPPVSPLTGGLPDALPWRFIPLICFFSFYFVK
jgi:hypothetical protein